MMGGGGGGEPCTVVTSSGGASPLPQSRRRRVHGRGHPPAGSVHIVHAQCTAHVRSCSMHVRARRLRWLSAASDRAGVIASSAPASSRHHSSAAQLHIALHQHAEQRVQSN